VLLPIHVAAGGLAIVLGTVALLVQKGGTVHRRSGSLFVYAMLVMGTSASILGLRKGGLTDGNVAAGLLALYFVGTALTTVRPASRWTRRIDAIALTFALALALFAIVLGARAVSSPGLSSGGVSHRTTAVMPFFVATVLLLAAIGDLRILRSGPPRGGTRLARHLWRMCFALFIASMIDSNPANDDRFKTGQREVTGRESSTLWRPLKASSDDAGFGSCGGRT
jgi:uncharacterized membrane protein